MRLPAISGFAARTAVAALAMFGTFRTRLGLIARLTSGLILVTSRRLFRSRSHFLVAIFHRGFARETDTALFIDAQTLDPDFIADFDDVFGLLDAEVCEFTDVAE